VPAEGEEVVVHTDRVGAKQVADHGGQDLLGLRAGGGPLPGQAGAAAVGRGQCGPVHLAARGQRQRVDPHQGRRHQVRRQPLREEAAQVVHGGVGADRVPDEPGVVALAAHDDDGVGDRRVFPEHRGHLVRLDPDAAQLDLVVEAPEEVQCAVGALPYPVAGAVPPGARPVRVGHEPFGRERGPAVVTAGHARTADDQLAGLADRHRPQVRVDDRHMRAVDGATDRRAAGVGADLGDGGPHRGLGRPVQVEHPPARCPPPDQRLRQRLARAAHHAEVGQLVVGQRGEHGRRQRDVRDALVAQGVPQVGAGRDVRAGRHDQRGTRAESHRHLEDRRVEARGRELQHPPARCHAEGAHLGGEQVRQSTVGQQDTLGPAGRPRRVDHVRDVVVADVRRCRLGAAAVGRRIQAGEPGGRRQYARRGVVGQQ
jgi:hypothetical protein